MAGVGLERGVTSCGGGGRVVEIEHLLTLEEDHHSIRFTIMDPITNDLSRMKLTPSLKDATLKDLNTVQKPIYDKNALKERYKILGRDPEQGWYAKKKRERERGRGRLTFSDKVHVAHIKVTIQLY